jgi:hypothetical protein
MQIVVLENFILRIEAIFFKGERWDLTDNEDLTNL